MDNNEVKLVLKTIINYRHGDIDICDKSFIF